MVPRNNTTLALIGFILFSEISVREREPSENRMFDCLSTRSTVERSQRPSLFAASADEEPGTTLR